VSAQALLFSPLDVAVTEVNDSEFHPTRERDVVEALILGMREAGHEPLPWHGVVREAAAGEGALVEHVEALVPSTMRRWQLCELKARLADACANRLRSAGVPRLHLQVGDFLARATAGKVDRVDLAITNPGFSRAIEWAAAELLTATHVALHLPLATLETEDRVAWLREHMPDVYPLAWRPDYDGRGGFNRPVCWLVWGPGRGGRWWPLRRPGGAR
jgi:hypothetical protein